MTIIRSLAPFRLCSHCYVVYGDMVDKHCDIKKTNADSMLVRFTDKWVETDLGETTSIIYRDIVEPFRFTIKFPVMGKKVVIYHKGRPIAEIFEADFGAVVNRVEYDARRN